MRAELVLAAAFALFLAVDARAFERHRYEEYPELEGKIVEQILLLGNNKTQDVVILREMRTMPGRPFKTADLWHDWERILDLGLFAQVEVDAVASGEQVLVVVSMYERPSWFLAPVLDYDFDEEKLTGGLQARLQNINGMNQQLRVRAVGGARENASISWQTPWIGQTRQTFGAELRVELPGDANDEFRTNLAGISTSRFLGDYKKVRQGVNANTRVEWIRRGATITEPEVDEVSPVIGAGLFRDTRNVRVDPDRGIFASTALEYASSWTSDDTEYVRGQIDLRGFKTLFPRLIVAARGQTVLTSGTVPSYRDLVVGGAGSIRGQPSEILRGTSIARSSVELRFKLLRSRRFGFTVPLLPEKVGQFTNFDLRIDGELFFDAGSAWTGASGFETAQAKYGAGFGFRLFLPVFELVRLELAFDEEGNATFYFREGNII